MIIPGPELGWDLGFELRLKFGIVLGVPVRYLLGYSNKMLLELTLCNYFGK